MCDGFSLITCVASLLQAVLNDNTTLTQSFAHLKLTNVACMLLDQVPSVLRRYPKSASSGSADLRLMVFRSCSSLIRQIRSGS